jgi:hypothetical protein
MTLAEKRFSGGKWLRERNLFPTFSEKWPISAA